MYRSDLTFKVMFSPTRLNRVFEQNVAIKATIAVMNFIRLQKSTSLRILASSLKLLSMEKKFFIISAPKVVDISPLMISKKNPKNTIHMGLLYFESFCLKTYF